MSSVQLVWECLAGDEGTSPAPAPAPRSGLLQVNIWQTVHKFHLTTYGQGWAIQGFGQVGTIPIKAVLQFSVRYDTDTILETNFQPDTIPIQYLRTIFNPI